MGIPCRWSSRRASTSASFVFHYPPVVEQPVKPVEAMPMSQQMGVPQPMMAQPMAQQMGVPQPMMAQPATVMQQLGAAAVATGASAVSSRFSAARALTLDLHRDSPFDRSHSGSTPDWPRHAPRATPGCPRGRRVDGGQVLRQDHVDRLHRGDPPLLPSRELRPVLQMRHADGLQDSGARDRAPAIKDGQVRRQRHRAAARLLRWLWRRE